MRVSEIRVKRIRVNQGLGVTNTIKSNSTHCTTLVGYATFDKTPEILQSS